VKPGLPMLLALAAAACDGAPAPAPRSWPQGTVLALGERPISAAEVDEAAGCIALLEPRDSLEHLRRLALTNVVLPRCAAQAIDPEARRQALALAQQCRSALESDSAVPGGPLPLAERKGRMLDLGLELWNAAMPLEPGQWTPVVETAGCFHVARLKEKGTAMLPGLVELTLEVHDFPYLPPDEAHPRIQAQLDRAQLHYVDESWRAFVPLAWQHRLQGGSP
jgi:hypothetical protein